MIDLVVDKVLDDASLEELEGIAVHIVQMGMGMLDTDSVMEDSRVQVISPATQRLLNLLEQKAVQHEISFDDAVESAINSLELRPLPPIDGMLN